MTDPSSPQDDDNNNEKEYACSVCQKTDVVFSKRQLKRAQRGDPAKCQSCAKMEGEDAIVESIDSLEEADAPEGQEAKFSDAEEEEEEVEEEEAKFSDQEEAQFSDEEVPEKKKETKDETTRKSNASLQIPRKRKADSKPSSLIANVEASKSTSAASAAIMTTAEEEADFKDSDQEEYDDPGSLNDMKQRIMGRKIRTHDDDEDEVDLKPAAQYTTDCKISHQLRKELACAICHECFLQPVTLLCGHSFCKECIQWWIQSSTSTKKNCPTCRLEIPIRSASSLGVNTALRACTLALLYNEVQIRMETERQSRKGENGGAHEGGYEVLVSAEADSWKTPGIAWSCRRSSVLDAEDQRMQLAMAIWKDSSSPGVVYNPRDCTLKVSLCMLHMEEDEVIDSGFPRVVDEEDEEDNEQLLVSRSGGRFVHSFMRATACHANGKKIPLGRRGIGATGVCEMNLELTSPEVARSDFISFEHEESGAVLDLLVPPEVNRKGAPRRQINQRAARALDDDEGEGKEYDSEDDGSHLDHYDKNDGFIADEAGDDENLHEHDLCAVCKEDGQLMVCDGGDNFEGCGRSFHIECVDRQEIPRGDWICLECSKSLDLDVGIEGHEFPMAGRCEKCEGDLVDLVCESGDDNIAACGKKFHHQCLELEELPSLNWICQTCALAAGHKVGIEGYEIPEEAGQNGDDAIEVDDDSEAEKSPPPAATKKRKRNNPEGKKRIRIDPDDVIDLEDSDDEDPEFDSPAKGGRHIGGDSDDDEEDNQQPPAKKGRRIGGDSDDDEIEVLSPEKEVGGDDGDEEDEDDGELEVLPPQNKKAATGRRVLALDDDDDE